MLRSLVGSEMCIRDRYTPEPPLPDLCHSSRLPPDALSEWRCHGQTVVEVVVYPFMSPRNCFLFELRNNGDLENPHSGKLCSGQTTTALPLASSCIEHENTVRIKCYHQQRIDSIGTDIDIRSFDRSIHRVTIVCNWSGCRRINGRVPGHLRAKSSAFLKSGVAK